MCHLDSFEGGGRVVEIAYIYLGGLSLGGSNEEKRDDHLKNKFL